MNIEQYVYDKLKSGKSYISAILDFCNDEDIEYEAVPAYLTKSIMDELEKEGVEMGVLKKSKKLKFLC